MVVFGDGVKTDLNIPFSSATESLLDGIVNIPYNIEREEGKFKYRYCILTSQTTFQVLNHHNPFKRLQHLFSAAT